MDDLHLNRFLSKIDKNTPTGCWIWLYGKSTDGYGRFKINGYTYNAHRVSYEHFCGEIPNGMSVCHKCDITFCVNPEHLFLGTPNDNMQDMVAKGRQHRPFGHKRAVGVKNGRCKLSEEDVLNIRKDNRFQKEIAEEYNITQTQVSAIKTKKTWKHLKDKDNV